MSDKKFVDYVLSFYGKGGIYKFRPAMRNGEASYALGILKRAAADGEYNWGDGDSIDREFARDIVSLMRGKRDIEYPAALRLFSKYAHKRWQRGRLSSVR